METPKLSALDQEIRRRESRKSLLAFVKNEFPEYYVTKFHEDLINRLQYFFDHPTGKRWNIANALLACGMVMAILCITIMGRTTGERTLILKPFASLAAARTQSEAYRELLMNIFLFFPFGLTLSNALPQSWGRWRRIGLTVITGLLLSAGIEYIQYRFALGVAETDDVICNTIGAFIGSTSLLIAHGIEKYNEKTIKHDSNKN